MDEVTTANSENNVVEGHQRVLSVCMSLVCNGTELKNEYLLGCYVQARIHRGYSN